MSIREDAIVKSERVKVSVKCNRCGQQFILRGTPGKDGRIETGFKMCFCDSTDFDVSVIK